jgi:hypothetical protein
MTVYQGMRWLKCDLQVQTPEDAQHWADPDMRLGEPRPRRGGTGRRVRDSRQGPPVLVALP